MAVPRGVEAATVRDRPGSISVTGRRYMPTDSIIFISGILVCVGVGAKLVTTNLLARQKRELTDLENEVDRRHAQLEELQQQRQAAEENIEFYERRREEAGEEWPELEKELERLLESERKHLESLGYYADEEGGLPSVPHLPDETTAAPTQGDPVTATAIAVLPADLGNSDKLFLPDAIVSHLLDLGDPVLERSMLAQRLGDQGESLGTIVEKEEYFKLGSLGTLKAIAIVNTLMQGAGVASATCRVVQIPAGTILLSTTYEQPGTHDSSSDYHRLTHTARVLAESIHEALRKTANPADVAPESG